MYKVVCQGKPHGIWRDYSESFNTKTQATKILQYAQSQNNISIYGYNIKYKIRSIK